MYLASQLLLDTSCYKTLFHAMKYEKWQACTQRGFCRFWRTLLCEKGPLFLVKKSTFHWKCPHFQWKGPLFYQKKVQFFCKTSTISSKGPLYKQKEPTQMKSVYGPEWPPARMWFSNIPDVKQLGLAKQEQGKHNNQMSKCNVSVWSNYN